MINHLFLASILVASPALTQSSWNGENFNFPLPDIPLPSLSPHTYQGFPEVKMALFAPFLASKVTNNFDAVLFARITAKESPTVKQTLEIKLPKSFEGISLTIPQYTDDRKKLSFQYVEKASQILQQPDKQSSSDYQNLLFKVAGYIMTGQLRVEFDDNPSRFFLYLLSHPHSIEVPLSTDTDNYPNEIPKKLNVLHSTSLTDMRNALSCYASHADSLLPSMINCGDEGLLLWNADKQLYVYQPAAIPPDFASGDAQWFASIQAWPLSKDFLLIAQDAMTFKISNSEDIDLTAEPVDANGSKKNKNHNTTYSTGKKSTSQSSGKHQSSNKQTDWTKGGAGGDDPGKRPKKVTTKMPDDAMNPEQAKVLNIKLKQCIQNQKELQSTLEQILSKRDGRNSPRITTLNAAIKDKTDEIKDLTEKLKQPTPTKAVKSSRTDAGSIQQKQMRKATEKHNSTNRKKEREAKNQRLQHSGDGH